MKLLGAVFSVIETSVCRLTRGAKAAPYLAVWRNWHPQLTQNQSALIGLGGSSPSTATKL